jgi:hypothetical protein
MLPLLALIFRLTAPSPAMTIDEMQDFQQHAEAALRLQAGAVEAPDMSLALPEWAFAEPRTPVELDAEMMVIGGVSPFASVDASPFAEGR